MKISVCISLVFACAIAGIWATPLTDAVQRNDLVAAERLLRDGAYVDAKDIAGYTPLMIAAGLGNFQMVELLLTAGADVNILDTRMGASALHKAAQGGVVPVAELLVRRGAFIDLAAPTHGHTPLMDAVWHRKPQMVEYLLSQGADAEMAGRDGSTARQWAEWGNHRDILSILDRYQADQQNYVREQKIFSAIEANDVEAVKDLIARGIDVNQKAKYRVSPKISRGETPLLLASRLGYAEIVGLLLDAGANPRIVDWLMKSTVLHKAGYMGRAEIILPLVEKGGEIDAQGPYNGYTALHDATWHGHLAAVKALIAAGARRDLKGHDGATPWDLAVAYCYPEIAEVLRGDSCRETAIEKCRAKEVGLIEVAHSQRRWTGVAVSKAGRIFVNYPRWSDDVPISVAEIKDGIAAAYPDEKMNSWQPGMTPEDHLVCVQSVVADSSGNLWILDPANPKFQGVIPGGPKLVQIDLKTDRIVRTYAFDAQTAPSQSYLNDVRIDNSRQVAYITDSGLGAIVVLDLNTGKARRLLAGHKSTQAEEMTLVIEGREWRLADGSVPRVHADGIALSPKADYLYYQALTGRSLYRIATEYLRDDGIKDPGSKVEFIARTGPADGLEFDAMGNLYLTSLEHNAIRRLAPDNTLCTVVQGKRVSWPDTLAITSDGAVYFTTSQIHLGDTASQPYRLFKFIAED